jgi:hypothetical protein
MVDRGASVSGATLGFVRSSTVAPLNRFSIPNVIIKRW